MNGDWFYTKNMISSEMEERPQKCLHPKTLQDGQLPNLKVLQEEVLK